MALYRSAPLILLFYNFRFRNIYPSNDSLVFLLSSETRFREDASSRTIFTSRIDESNDAPTMASH